MNDSQLNIDMTWLCKISQWNVKKKKSKKMSCRESNLKKKKKKIQVKQLRKNNNTLDRHIVSLKLSCKKSKKKKN